MERNRTQLRGAALLMLTALIWGTAFVAQSVGMDHLGPCAFTAVRNYIDNSNANCGRVTIEYVLLDHVNDSTDQAHELAYLLRDLPCKINLIPFNPHEQSEYQRPSNSRIDRFYKVLVEQYGMTVVTRTTRGDDIAAACGQLAGQVNDRKLKAQIEAAEREALRADALALGHSSGV